jgi:sarcosine oxidase
VTATTYDCVVIGAGGFGSAALDHVAARGARVLGIDRFGIAHDQGSSHGHTRVTRQAYFEHPDYVPLLIEAYRLWDDLAQHCQQPLIDRCGLLLAGRPDGPAVAGTRQAARLHDLELQDVSQLRLAKDFPGFQIPDEFDAVWEAEGGYLFVEDAVRAHIARAQHRGAVLRTPETVLEWAPVGDAFEVVTDRDRYHCGSLIIAPGAWVPNLLPELEVDWEIVRKPLFWFPTSSHDYDRSRGAGVFFLETAGGEFYGFPSLDGQTVKLAEHTGGQNINDPLAVDRNVLDIDLPPLANYLQSHMPGLSTSPARHVVCLYTRTPDRHFIVDKHPRHNGVAIACGFSGHGFKFTPVIGSVLADLALDGTTDHAIDFLAATRPGLLSSD